MRVALLACLCAASASAGAVAFRFDQSSAEITFEGSYDGEPVPGRFHRFEGSADFDAANPLAARFAVTIDVASLDTEYPDRDEVLKNADWFAVESHPEARWISTGPCTPAGSAFQCPGELTLRGTTRPVAIEIVAEGTALAGRATVDRRAFGVGSGEWDEAATIADLVTVRFRLAPRAH